MSLLWVFLGLILLVVGGEFLVRSSVALSLKFNISKLIIGLTVVSFATSAPELLVSVQAALNGSPDIALGNVIGSNIANLGLVLGITAVISPLVVDKSFYKMHWPIMLLLSVALYFFLQSGNVLNFNEGLGLFTALMLFIFILIRKAKRESTDEAELLDVTLVKTSSFKIIIWLIIGGVALYFGSDWLVFGAREMAISLGVSERTISVTMVAIGTSVPELAASVIAALKKEKAISLGNLIGSNIFNIAGVLGITAMIQDIPVVSSKILSEDIFWMLAFAVILLPFIVIPKSMTITRWKGGLLVVGYLVFVFLAFAV